MDRRNFFTNLFVAGASISPVANLGVIARIIEPPKVELVESMSIINPADWLKAGVYAGNEYNVSLLLQNTRTGERYSFQANNTLITKGQVNLNSPPFGDFIPAYVNWEFHGCTPAKIRRDGDFLHIR